MSQLVYCTITVDLKNISLPRRPYDPYSYGTYGEQKEIEENQECTIVPDDWGYMQIPIVLSLLVGMPLNVAIIYRLLTKGLIRLDHYHLFIVGQCSCDLLFIFIHVAIAVLNTQSCTLAPVVMSALMLLSDVLLGLQHISICYLSTYWKSLLRPQCHVDVAMYAIISVSYGALEIPVKIAAAIVNFIQRLRSVKEELIGEISTYVSLLLNVAVVIAIYNFVYITIWDTSKFTKVCRKSHKKMSVSLLLQALLVFSIAAITQIFVFSIHNATSSGSTLMGLADQLKVETSDSKKLELVDKVHDEESRVVKMLNMYSKITFIFFGILPFLKVLLMWWSIKGLFRKVSTHTATTHITVPHRSRSI